MLHMKKIEVKLAERSYQILIGPGLLAETGTILRELGLKNKVVIITNPVIKRLYGARLQTELNDSGYESTIVEVPEGEEHKSLAEAGRLYSWLSEVKAERSTPVLALGGGVIGDLAGFVAATYMRGVPLVQIPTTLLAQVDSSIGGKTAVNHERLKNNIGTFYQPKVVLSDISTLRTLPEAELENGLAEAIKYGVVRDSELFGIIENNLAKLKKADKTLCEEIVFRCAGIKADLVEKDERDVGIRNILNYGHTTGHGIEPVSDFKIAHGQAVAIGMAVAATISQRKNILSSGESDRIKSVIAKAGLPVKVPQFEVGKIIQAMQHDKKRVEGKNRFILPKSIGEVFMTDEVTDSMVESVLKDLQ
jgi:3-dehydroquinate synthase